MTTLETAQNRIDMETRKSYEALSIAGELPDLAVTVPLMTSGDYKERMLAEYWQLKIRYEKLKKFNNQIEAAQIMGEEGPKHTCPAYMLKEQQSIMKDYLHVLEVRAVMEGITL